MTLLNTDEIMEKKLLKRQKPDEFFKARVAVIKSTLARTPWRRRFLEKFPEWDNADDLSYLDRVYLMRTADVNVTEELELIAQEFAQTEH